MAVILGLIWILSLSSLCVHNPDSRSVKVHLQPSAGITQSLTLTGLAQFHSIMQAVNVCPFPLNTECRGQVCHKSRRAETDLSPDATPTLVSLRGGRNMRKVHALLKTHASKSLSGSNLLVPLASRPGFVSGIKLEKVILILVTWTPVKCATCTSFFRLVSESSCDALWPRNTL